MNMPTADCRSHPPVPATIIAPRRRPDSARLQLLGVTRRETPLAPEPLDRQFRLALSAESPTDDCRIVRRVVVAKDVDRIAWLQSDPGKHRVDVEREVDDRERADPIESPDRDALHRVAPRPRATAISPPPRRPPSRARR